MSIDSNDKVVELIRRYRFAGSEFTPIPEDGLGIKKQDLLDFYDKQYSGDLATKQNDKKIISEAFDKIDSQEINDVPSKRDGIITEKEVEAYSKFSINGATNPIVGIARETGKNLQYLSGESKDRGEIAEYVGKNGGDEMARDFMDNGGGRAIDSMRGVESPANSINQNGTSQPVTYNNRPRQYPDGSIGGFAETHENSGLMFGALGGLVAGMLVGEGFSVFAMLIGALFGTYFVDGENGAVGSFFNKHFGGGRSPSLGGYSPNIQTGYQQGQNAGGRLYETSCMPSQYYQLSDADREQGTVILSLDNQGRFIKGQQGGQMLVRGTILENGDVRITDAAEVRADGTSSQFYSMGDKAVTVKTCNGVLNSYTDDFQQALHTGGNRIKYEHMQSARQQAGGANIGMVTGGHDTNGVSSPNCTYQGAAQSCSVRT